MDGCYACTTADLAFAAQLALDEGNDEVAEQLYGLARSGGLSGLGFTWPWEDDEGTIDLYPADQGETIDWETEEGSGIDWNAWAKSIGSTAETLLQLFGQARAGAAEAKRQLDAALMQYRAKEQEKGVPGWVWAAGAGAAALVLVLALKR